LNQQITAEAHNLATALKGRKKMQGNWGELLLENVLERSGLQAGKDYQRELSTYSMDGARARPDAVIYLPQNKHLIIDAKVSLNAYVRYINAEDEQQRQLALKQHVMAVSQRIKELAERDYYKLPRLNSPEVVFMFVPVESAFVDAVKAEPGLFQQAMDQRVLVTTPTTLLTSLTIVRQLWRYEHQNKHTAELVKSVENIFAKVNGFLTSFYGVKKGLDKAQECYLKAESQLVSGRSNLVKQVTDLKNLAPTIKGQLPDYFTEKAELEVEIPDTESAG
jgi:DNA recombination protein RmuC